MLIPAFIGVWQPWKIRHIGSLISKLNTLCFHKETNPRSGKHTLKFLKPKTLLILTKYIQTYCYRNREKLAVRGRCLPPEPEGRQAEFSTEDSAHPKTASSVWSFIDLSSKYWSTTYKRAGTAYVPRVNGL